MDCWVPGALFSLSEEPSDNEGNPELGPGIEDAGAGTGIGMGEVSGLLGLLTVRVPEE